MSEFNFPDELRASVDSLPFASAVEQLGQYWASFTLSIISPDMVYEEKAKIIHPEPLGGTQTTEFVYPIYDHYSKLVTSKGLEMYVPGLANCKFFYTIEKMISILITRITESGSVDEETEVQIAFDGHELGKRKAFESVINLTYNVIVINFDPGAWGERYLQIVKNLADKGYGYPEKAPRTIYQLLRGPGKNSQTIR